MQVFWHAWVRLRLLLAAHVHLCGLQRAELRGHDLQFNSYTTAECFVGYSKPERRRLETGEHMKPVAALHRGARIETDDGQSAV